MASMDFIISGDVAIAVTVTEVDGNLEFNVRVIQPGEEGYTGQIGEINGLFFDLLGNVDEIASLTATTAAGDSLFMEVDEASVSNLGGGVNLNGATKETGKFDVGVLLDETGLGNGDLQEITFTLDADIDLSLDDVALQDFGVRLTSVGEPDGSRDGSLKLTGSAPEAPEEPPMVINMANDDFIFADSSAEFDGVAEVLDFGITSILWNDTTDAGAGPESYTGSVTEANGTVLDGGAIVVAGSNGGLLMVYADGTTDFSANGEFEFLGAQDQAFTEFTYAIEGGDTATIVVAVSGFDDPGGELGEGGGDLGDPPPPLDEFLF